MTDTHPLSATRRKPGRPAGRDSRKPPAIAPGAVRQWREGLGLTQGEAAQAIGVTRDTMARYEASGAPLTSALAMRAIAAGLRVEG